MVDHESSGQRKTVWCLSPSHETSILVEHADIDKLTLRVSPGETQRSPTGGALQAKAENSQSR